MHKRVATSEQGFHLPLSEQPAFLHCSTCRIVGIATISRPEHRVAQTREVACTKIVLPQVIARGLHLVCYMCFINIVCLNMYSKI